MRIRTPLVVLPLMVVSVGCGSAKTTTTAKTVARAASGAPVEKPLTGIEQFKACVEKGGANLAPEAPTHDGRIAIGRAGSLPVAYAGAVTWSNGAYMDVWLAANATDAAATAQRLNEAQAESTGVSKAKQAYSNGRAVGAPGSNNKLWQLGDAAKKVEACMTATNG
jgi:hypothetical protein